MSTMEANDSDDFKLKLENVSTDIIALVDLNFIPHVYCLNHTLSISETAFL